MVSSCSKFEFEVRSRVEIPKEEEDEEDADDDADDESKEEVSESGEQRAKLETIENDVPEEVESEESKLVINNNYYKNEKLIKSVSID